MTNSNKRKLKKGVKGLIAVLVVLLCGVFAFVYFNRPGDPAEPVADSSASPSAEAESENTASENKEEAEPTSEATIQEDNGEITITIPDDQESAGE